MLFPGGPRSYPGLTRYLHDRKRRDRTTHNFDVGEWIGSVLASVGMFVSILPALPLAIRLGLVGAGLGWYAILGLRWAKWRQSLPVPTPLQIEANAERERLGKALVEKRLDVDTPKAVMELFEECARLWLRVEQAVGGGFWRSKTLSAHHARLRQQALDAADQAMDEIVLLLRPTINPTGRRADWKDYAETIVDRFVSPRPAREEPMPPEFGPARKLADRLHHLAVEVEQMALRTVLDPEVAVPDAGRSIESVLGEMTAVRMAEQELDERIRQR